MKQLIFSLFIVCFTFNSLSQVDFIPKSSFKVEVGLPNNVSNYAFRDQLQGLVVLTPSFQYTFDNTLSVGAGLRYGFFNVNEFKNNVDLSGGVHIAGIFAKIGQEKYYGNFGIDYGVRLGYATNIFDTNKNDSVNGKSFINDAVFIEPTLGLSLLATEKTSFRLVLGYAVHDFVFSPEQIGVDQFSGIKDSQIENRTSYFTIGFGYSYYFGKQ